MKTFDTLFCFVSFIALYVRNIMAISNKNLDVSKTGVETVTSQSVGLVLFADVNNTSEDLDYDVVASPDKCCIDINSQLICNIVEVVGECIETVPKGAVKRLRFVAPLVDPIERRGYCYICLDSKPRFRQRKVMRNIIKIPVDTRLKNKKQKMEIMDNVTECIGIDEDPLNACKPIDCESYYNGKRSFYDKKLKRCVSVPVCLADNKEEIPNIIYDTKKNKCTVGDSITKDDLKFIQELTYSGKKRRIKDILVNVPKKMHKKSTKIVQGVDNEILYTPDINNDLYYTNKSDLKSKKILCIVTKYLMGNIYMLIILIVVIIIQCCLICTMIFCFSKNCKKYRKTNTLKQIFNYTQDASITTPLICSSNIDTDTTEFQYISGPSNIENQIKSYKAFHKERNTNTMKSMSDDILSKLINRRDWNHNKLRSKIIPDSNTLQVDSTAILKGQVVNENKSTYYKTYENKECKKTIDVDVQTTVNFETKQPKSYPELSQIEYPTENVNHKMSNESKSRTHKEILDELSEKEIKNHSYNYLDISSNILGVKSNGKSKRLGFYKSDKTKTGVSLSTEKGAQASFSNDSIDDFLSERRITFAGENTSKYSFSSQSTSDPLSITSEVSGKTSKNNVVKQMLSLLHKKSKQSPCSEPGGKNSVELIHLSKASVYSSSNNESECFKSVKRTKDSRLSF
ncbi:hypothetical protein ACJJTC_019147 [Scirpophaga incertulas]